MDILFLANIIMSLQHLNISITCLIRIHDNEIIPILATIPTVPSVNNEGKNTWIRNSNYQYIDFAKAVGATPDGVWFDDMLSSDNVHPSEKGGLALYNQVLTDFPQIMIS